MKLLWSELILLPREAKDTENDIFINYDERCIRFHCSWYTSLPVPGNIYYYGWFNDGKGYSMYLGRKTGEHKKMNKMQKRWLMMLLESLGAISGEDIMFDIFQIHRDRIDPLPIRNPIYIYPRLSFEERRKCLIQDEKGENADFQEEGRSTISVSG